VDGALGVSVGVDGLTGVVTGSATVGVDTVVVSPSVVVAVS